MYTYAILLIALELNGTGMKTKHGEVGYIGKLL
jgi:hypothetical protein